LCLFSTGLKCLSDKSTPYIQILILNLIFRILIVSDLESKDISGVNMVHSSVKLASDFTGEQLLNAILSKTTTSSWPSWEVSDKR